MRYTDANLKTEHYDLVVCGAGPGGIGAALSAARLGHRVLLLDQAGCVGGYWTSGLMGIALDMPGKGGIPLEICNALMAEGAARWVDASSYTYDIEAMKRLLEGMLAQAGVDILLHTSLSTVDRREGRITAVHTAGFHPARFTADFWVDGTGHGTLGMLAGCAYEMGEPKSGLLQPASLHAVVTGVPDAWQTDIHSPEKKQALHSLLSSVGVTPSYPAPLLFQPRGKGPIWILAINHQYHVTAEDAFTVSNATVQARREIDRAVQAIQTLPGWDGFALCATAEQIGLRDSRRITGLYRITVEDAIQGLSFPDGVVPIHSCIDVHQLMPDGRSDAEGDAIRLRPFQIPMRSLIAAACENLFLVGRCISGDFLSHSAYRMTNSACAMGEAVGIALHHVEDSARGVDGGLVKAEMRRRKYLLA